MNEIVKEYGAGLFALAHEDGIEKKLLDEARAISPIFTGEYVHLLINPKIPKEERVSLVSAALDGRVNTYVANFVKLMTERGLADSITECFAEYERLYYSSNGIVRVTAESPVALTDEQKSRLTAKMSAHLGAPVEITYLINSALIGGMRLMYDNRLIDSSVASKLREIGEKLSSVVI